VHVSGANQEDAMNDNKPHELREKAKNWKCNQLSITDHGGDAAGLLRKLADAIEQLGDIGSSTSRTTGRRRPQSLRSP
jgi:hypothetical protein